MNIKSLPYKTVWVEYPDIAPLAKKLGATPTSTTADGAPHYTLPMIYDPNTTTTVTESAAIARYLDRTYPNPVLIPKGTDALHEAFTEAFRTALATDLVHVGLLPTWAQLNPYSQEYFRRTREARFGKLEDVAPEGSEKRAKHWKAVEDGLHMLKGWIEADGTEKLFFTGESIAYADVTVAAFLTWIKTVFGEGSKEWRDVMEWDDGRWARFMGEFDAIGGVDFEKDV